MRIRTKNSSVLIRAQARLDLFFQGFCRRGPYYVTANAVPDDAEAALFQPFGMNCPVW
jgi:hypothetical protein